MQLPSQQQEQQQQQHLPSQQQEQKQLHKTVRHATSTPAAAAAGRPIPPCHAPSAPSDRTISECSSQGIDT